MKTLITDGFADDEPQWLDGDDRALLMHTLEQIISKHLGLREPARMAEPAPGTIWLDRSAPGGPVVWVRYDGIGRPREYENNWSRNGLCTRFQWPGVLVQTDGRELVQLFEPPFKE
jgi:hypothetical protein